ncbi:E3 ubiquitin-protein ligase TTC3 isoform X2 [Festucalex cinctus]
MVLPPGSCPKHRPFVMYGSSFGHNFIVDVDDQSDSDPEPMCETESDCKHLGCNNDGEENNGLFSTFESAPFKIQALRPDHPPVNFTKVYVSDSWNHISVDVKKAAGHLMRLYTYWMPLLLNVDAMNETYHWAMRVGLLNPHDPNVVNLKMLFKIETVQAILRALEVGSMAKENSSHIILLATSFRENLPGALEDALQLLEQAGEPDIRPRIKELGHKRTRYAALSFIFIEYLRYISHMGMNVIRMMEGMKSKPSERSIAASDYHKKLGNELFQEEKYEKAEYEYSRAIKINPENHIAFSNRALCHTRCEKYLEAAVDAKRATLIEPHWTKGHYRYCEALFLLGEVDWAFSANASAQSLCKHDCEGLKDLEQQFQRFTSEVKKCSSGNKVEPSKKKQSVAKTQEKTQHATKPAATNKSTVVESQQSSGKEDGNGSSNNNKKKNKDNGACKAAGGTINKQNQPVINKTTSTKEPPKVAAAVKDKTVTTKEPPKTPKKKSTARKEQPEQPQNIDKIKMYKDALSHVIGNGHTALKNQCYYNAENSFRDALGLLDSFTKDENKEIGFSALDMQLLLYGRVSALMEIGKTQELAEARKLLEKIKSYEERVFQCLVYYAYGRIYLKENNYSVAMEHFQDSMQMVRNQITPGKLTWPLTKEIVQETEMDHFKKLLEDSIYLCKFPPRPNGICRYVDCLCSTKNIYITDPDFKGYVEFKCSQKCLVEYHNACWKVFKPSSFEKTEKPCLTPDCSGIIDSIKIIDSMGLIKNVLVTNRRAESPRKPKVNQKPPCVKKLKEKNHFKKENHNKQTSEKKAATVSVEVPPAKTSDISQIQQNAWLLYQDRVLVQLSQMMQLLHQEKALAVSAVSACLKPWLELDSARGNRLAGKMLNWEQERLETLDQAVELLLERKNRVWARVFIQLLSNTLDINVELSRWAGRLNDADLKAAESFIERNADHLDGLDLTPVLTFAPLKEIISDNCPPGSDFISSNLTKYVKQAPPHEMRLFIWTLEEHKDIYGSFNILMDEYFVSMIDGHCTVLKKSDNQNSFPASDKSRGRKKKPKEPRIPLALSKLENDAADEWDQDDPMYFLDPNEPFRIPSHLQGQVAEFEEQYNATGYTKDFKKILDNNPDPTMENLYDYFAQILEEHGPLPADDPQLQGEIENFPAVARTRLANAGGIEPFLQQSLRFINIGGRVGLAKHAVALQLSTHLDHLAPPPVFSSSPTASPNLRNAEPYITFDLDELLPPKGKGPANQSGHDLRSPKRYTCEVDESWETFSFSSDLSVTPPEVILKKHAEVQTYQAVKDCIAVNTEPLKPYESNQGDINKAVKRINKMEALMSKKADDCEKEAQKHQETLASVEKDIQEICTNIKVTDKELSLFQRKLEEEVKKDQKEKKANQEELKALKIETEKLVEQRGSLTKQIKANKANFDDKLSRFLELSHQSAVEKMSLEDEITRYKNSIAAAIRRSRSAQLSMLESSRDQRLYGLHAQLADVKTLLAKLDDSVQRFPSLETMRQNVRAKVQDLEQNIAAAETQYKEQVEQVKSGRSARDVLSSCQTDLQVSALSSDLAALSVAPAPPSQPTAAAAPAPATETRNAAKPSQTANTVFEKAMESLRAIFPDYTRSDLMKFLKELRSSNGGSLSSMTLQDVMSGVSQLILEHKEAIASGTKSETGAVGGATAATPPLVDPPPVWQPGKQKSISSNPLNLEDPCIICQEEMSPPDRLVLECRHTFHKDCITSWLKEKSTCPTCRKDTMFKEFPLLPSRRRQAP